MLLNVSNSIPVYDEINKLRDQLRPIADMMNEYGLFVNKEIERKNAIDYINKHQIPFGICVLTTEHFCAGNNRWEYKYYILYNRMVVAESYSVKKERKFDEVEYKTSYNSIDSYISYSRIISYIKDGCYDFKTYAWNGAYCNRFDPFDYDWRDYYQFNYEEFVCCVSVSKLEENYGK